MEFTEFGDGEDRLLFVLGWGNRAHHENVRWLIDELVDAGYTVDVGEIPHHPSDFDAEYLEPTQKRHDETDPDRLLSHSTGGLITAHLDAETPRVYLSPWWGIPGDPSLLQRLIVSLPVARPILPVPFDPDAIGELATEQQAEEGPDYASPAFLRTIADAQERVPPFRADSVVFCTLEDTVVSVEAIGAHADAERVRAYDGGHEFFSSLARDTTMEWVLAALADGPAALSTPGEQVELHGRQ
jgi:hypothetical protein